MSLVSVAELREALGIGALYDDADLQQCLDAADDLILSQLKTGTVGVWQYLVKSNQVMLFTLQPCQAVVGQTVIVSAVGSSLNGSHTLTSVQSDYVTYSHTHANESKVLVQYGSVGNPIDYSTTPAVLEAALMTAADIYQSRFATNGQPVGVDFTPAPYRMGRSLLTRVSGLLAPYMATDSMVG